MVRDKQTNNIIVILAILVSIIAIINFTVTIIRYSNFNQAITGYATGYVNLTVTQNLVINLTKDRVNFGPGTINSTCNNITMWTSNNTLLTNGCGNWSVTGTNHAEGIVIQNLGSVNFTLAVTSSINANDFFGPTGSPSYMWNFTDKESGTCGQIGNYTLSNFFEVNKSMLQYACRNFSYSDIGFGAQNHNEMLMDVYVRVPLANNITDGLQRLDTITLTATFAG